MALPDRLTVLVNTAILSLLAGWGAAAIHLPLPWMLGPLFATGLAGVYGVKTNVVEGGRQFGQLLTGVALGHYFTAPVLAAVLTDAPWLLANCLAALFAGLLTMRLLANHLTPATAFFSMLPGGAAEMAVLGARQGGDPAMIALCHSLRVVSVVSTIPFAMLISGVEGHDSYQSIYLNYDHQQFALLMALALLAGFLCHHANLPNAWLFGPLLISIILTASGTPLSALPHWMLNAAQWLIGSALGCRFKPGMFTSIKQLMPRLLASLALSQLLLVLFGVLLAKVHHIPVATAILATAPGGMAEMCLTARNLHLGVAYITASQLCRLVFLLCSASIIYKLWFADKKRPPG